MHGKVQHQRTKTRLARVYQHTHPHPPTRSRPTHSTTTMHSSTTVVVRTAALTHAINVCVRAGILTFWASHVKGGDKTPRKQKKSPGVLLSTPPARRVWRWGPFFRRKHLVQPCGAGLARCCGRAGSDGARQQPVFNRYTETGIVVKIQLDIITTTEQYNFIGTLQHQ